MSNKTHNVISAKSAGQKNYIRTIIENDITLCYGMAGTGKDYVALGIAIEHIFRSDKPQTKLVISKPMVSTGQRDFPYIKGDLMEKLLPYYGSIISNLIKIIGDKKRVKGYIEDEVIVMSPIELMRGETFDNSFVVITEMQNSDIDQAVMAITRIGDNTKLIMNGDISQRDLKVHGDDGLSYLLRYLRNSPDLVGVSQLTEADIQRHPKIGRILTQLNWKKEI